MRIIYDAMGGDYAPFEIVKGGLLAEDQLGITPIFAGDPEAIKDCLNKLDKDTNKYEVLESKTVIENDEEPVVAIRRKKDSSVVVGLNSLAKGEAEGLISAGSTGALLAGGLFLVKRLENVERSPIVTSIPTKGEPFLLVDSGANVDTTPELLNQFATMGSIYIEKTKEIDNPKVALLNIGKEEGKGNNLYKKTYELLKENELINFVGNIEPRELPFGGVDVVVADGFDGNVFIKTYEGTAGMITEVLKENLPALKNPELIEPFKKLMYLTFSKFDYSAIGGAPLLGLNKPVFKAHGISKGEAILGASRQVKDFVEGNVIETMKENFEVMKK